VLADPVEDILQAALGHAPVSDSKLVAVSLHLIEEELGLEALEGDLVHKVAVELPNED
jgi:hypothetical protein